MIAPLRRRHRWMTAVLLVLLPLGFFAALAARPEQPLNASLQSFERPDPKVGILLIEDEQAFDGRLTLRVLAGEQRASPPVLELAPNADLQLPDVLVYWQSMAIEPAVVSAGTVAPQARLLGTLGGLRARRFELPRDVALGTSRVSLYSLAQRRTDGTYELRRLQGDHR